MNIYIRNMVCVRCKMAVQSVLKELEIEYHAIDLGRVELAGQLSHEKQIKLNAALKHYKLELMDGRRNILVERIKIVILELFQNSNSEPVPKFSEYLSKILDYDYTYMANTFSEIEGSTIEKFYILSRVERAKELLVYEVLSIKEIAYLLNYRSVSHFCVQFKKVTGETPSAFKKLCELPSYNWRTCE